MAGAGQAIVQNTWQPAQECHELREALATFLCGGFLPAGMRVAGERAVTARRLSATGEGQRAGEGKRARVISSLTVHSRAAAAASLAGGGMVARPSGPAISFGPVGP